MHCFVDTVYDEAILRVEHTYRRAQATHSGSQTLLKLLQELDYRKGKRFWDGRIVQATNAMRLDLNEELGSYTYKQEMSIIV